MMLPCERVRQEEALRGAVLAGDQAAWRTLYDGAYAELWAYVAWRCAGLGDLAEEITQETWLVAVRRIGDFEPRQGRFQGWLRGIAAHVLHNHFRTRRRRPEQALSGDEPAQDDQERRDQAELIARALAELPERCEAVLRAKYFDLMSVEQIAAEADQSPKAIESLLTRARQAFRTAYEKLAGSDAIMEEPKP
jgi:RNA polymerase sigma-70 factor, ECF subfamily